MYVDETGTDQKSKILAIACIITRDPDYLKDSLEKFKQALLKDNRIKDIPSIKNLEGKGFHYCEDHFEIIPLVIDLIAKLPFEAYIYYIHKEHDFCPSNNFEWYDQLFGKLMYDRIQNHQKASINICFEQHGKPSKREEELRKILARLIYKSEVKGVGDFSFFPSVRSAGKEESCLAIADYVAAIFKNHENALKDLGEYKLQSNPSSQESRYFSMLRPKIRVIHNYGTGEFFTRRNPFP
jgi:hypothetical protein